MLFNTEQTMNIAAALLRLLLFDESPQDQARIPLDCYPQLGQILGGTEGKEKIMNLTTDPSNW